jgi:hypothetical protein
LRTVKDPLKILRQISERFGRESGSDPESEAHDWLGPSDGDLLMLAIHGFVMARPAVVHWAFSFLGIVSKTFVGRNRIDRGVDFS